MTTHAPNENEGREDAPRVADDPSKETRNREGHLEERGASEQQPDNPYQLTPMPPFDDPAFSARPAGSPVQAGDVGTEPEPVDPRYAGHPEFSQDAATNKAPTEFGNSEPPRDVEEETRHSEGVNPSHPSPQQHSGAGSALASPSKDADSDQ
ncbi:MAG: hypothetical protein K5872_09715 [Rhizobiaceae bacterium]|nr:hypothetical protein [Rhizobiaceae bacterium]MCV0406490.1 hypothetical protein [Rhizobiaceae bacterium]